ncbi:hypothetical protein LCGC14_0792030 [marine sediment metagenome]|uniref:Uncharacterized protein n=1 Tax=marine sediment metagenome TaxID=412755 RepID=A0A0F9SZD3_9ZZZZ
MKIKTSQGRHFKEDKLLWFQTNGSEKWEAISLRKLLLLINKLGVNEVKKYKRILENGGELWFEESIKEILELNKKEIDLTNEENKETLLAFCNKWKLPTEKVIQTKLGELEL